MSNDATTVGKLYHQILVSRWQHAVLFKKHDKLISEVRVLRNNE